MSDLEGPQLETILNTSQLSANQLLDKLSEYPVDSQLRIDGVSTTAAGLLAGLDRSLELTLTGNVGPYALMGAQQAVIDIVGHAAIGCGHSFQSGSLLVRGDAGNFWAAYATGGFLAIHGKTADWSGFGLAGADVMIRGRCGHGAGAMMQSGTLVLGNGCGQNLGQGMRGGIIYVRGEIGSVSSSVRTIRMKESDNLRLSLILVRAGIKASSEKFVAFRAVGDRS